MPDQQQYLQQGIEAARSARALTDPSWGDSWKNYAAQYALAKQQNDYDLNLWNMMNEYNSPQSQMQRFKEAGLNPMLVYQQGTPGNASSPANSTMPNVQLTPQKDAMQKVAMANDVIGMVSNLAKNVASLWGSGYDLQIKKNEVLASDFDRSIMDYTFPSYGSKRSNPIEPYYNFDNAKLNPLSPDFDPLVYLAFQKQGQLPTFFNNFLTSDSQRALLGFKASYQDYYNKHLLPKFNEYQQGKIDLLEIEKELENYNKTSLEMIPPEWRGIIQPVLDWISPFIKFIFKSSTVKHFVK